MKGASEVDLAAVVVEHFLDLDFEVFQEVRAGSAGPVADIVLRQGHALHIIEVKRSASLAVLGQAARWRRQPAAHRVSVAVPLSPRSVGADGLVAACSALGIGLYSVSTHRCDYAPALRVVVRPTFLRLRPKLSLSIGRWLREEHKTWAPAGSTSGAFSPFKATCRDAARFVAQYPGCTLRELVAGIRHHYATDTTARGALSQWIQADKVPGIEKRGHRPMRLYPSPVERAAIVPPVSAEAGR